MGIPPDHFVVRPSSKLLKNRQRGPSLNMPTGQGVSKIMPAEIRDSRSLQSLFPCLRIDLPYRMSIKNKDPFLMIPLLPPENIDDLLPERNSYCSLSFCLVGVNPTNVPLEIDLAP